ncbi:hypothetical protein PAMA_003743 [Pampus argenteus]
MESSQSQAEPGEEMSFEQESPQDFNKAGRSHSYRQTCGRGLFTDGGRSAFPRDRLVAVSLALLNAVLLIAAVVTGIYCAKANDDYLQINSDAAPLMIELDYLLNNSSEVIKAKLEAEAALETERKDHMQRKLQLKHQNNLLDSLQSQIETLLAEKRKLQNNKTALEESCGRCRPGWTFIKSSCYYFSNSLSDSKKNWPDSRADCISRGGDLLVINDLQEQLLVSENLPVMKTIGLWWQQGYWMGLTDAVTEGTWVWINNVTEVETMYWKQWQPNHIGAQSGHCVAAVYHMDARKTWYNGNCQNHLFNWVCEMEPTQV